MGFLDEARKHRALVAEKIYSRVLQRFKFEISPELSSRKKISQLPRPFVIGEVKPASPSQGFISTVDWLKIRDAYAEVDAVSVLTEEKYFLGSFFNVMVVSSLFPEKPVLGKDFVVSREQIELLRYFGATNYLVIVEMLEEDEIRFMLNIGEPMEPVLEVRSMKDLSLADRMGARVVGINSRNLKDLSISFEEIYPLVERARDSFETVIVESGISKPEDVSAFSGLADGVLIGTTFMRGLDKVPSFSERIREILRGD